MTALWVPAYTPLHTCNASRHESACFAADDLGAAKHVNGHNAGAAPGHARQTEAVRALCELPATDGLRP